MIDKKLIYDFREEVNSNEWCYFKYRNNNNRNQWSCICSAMDWIQVSVEYIVSHPLSSISEYGSIELFSYISCVDIVVEAIEQLHRVIYSTNKCIYEKDRECFCDNKFNQNDKEYFKTLRACFGAHPVNLDDPDNDEDRRFASWSGGFFGSDNFSVILYSNQINKPDIFIDMKYSQIDYFLEKYYNHLTELIKELRKQYRNFCVSKKKQIIESSNDPITQLKILQKENRERLDYDYYNYTIEELLLLFETPITCVDNFSMVSRYREYLKTVVKEIYDNLQSMNLESLKNEPLLMPETTDLPNGWGYALSKLSDAVHSNSYLGLLSRERFEQLFNGKFVHQYETLNELYVLVHASLYELSQRQ